MMRAGATFAAPAWRVQASVLAMCCGCRSLGHQADCGQLAAKWGDVLSGAAGDLQDIRPCSYNLGLEHIEDGTLVTLGGGCKQPVVIRIRHGQAVPSIMAYG